jgi:hypothetical protein
MIELGVIALSPELLRCHMHHDGLGGHLQRRHRDAILLREILQGVDVGVARIEPEVVIGESTQRLDGDAAPRPIPDDRQRGYTLTGEVHVTGQHRIVDGRGPAELDPADLDIAHTGGGEMFFDQLQTLHDHCRQIDSAELRRWLESQSIPFRLRLGPRGGCA